MKRMVFEIKPSYEPAAGLIFHGDKLVVEIESGEPGGEEGEFRSELASFLQDWYGSSVTHYEQE